MLALAQTVAKFAMAGWKAKTADTAHTVGSIEKPSHTSWNKNSKTAPAETGATNLPDFFC